uniref:Single domain-containing protein n=1 Tax=Timema bartmani TaxID=61472 RepID=A0A7R9F7E2_9NEOP|nr:unnamed protein product [Timema bartmani]
MANALVVLSSTAEDGEIENLNSRFLKSSSRLQETKPITARLLVVTGLPTPSPISPPPLPKSCTVTKVRDYIRCSIRMQSGACQTYHMRTAAFRPRGLLHQKVVMLRAATLLVFALLEAGAAPKSNAHTSKMWEVEKDFIVEMGAKCMDPFTKDLYQIGKKWHRKGQCSELSCAKIGERPNGSPIVEGKVVHCLDLTVTPECEEKKNNPSLPYPECCPALICGKDRDEPNRE